MSAILTLPSFLYKNMPLTKRTVKISATPWNLLSASSALDLTTTISAKQKGVLASRESTNKLHLIDWDEGIVARVRQGLRMKLMVMTTTNNKATGTWLKRGSRNDGNDVIARASDIQEAR